MAVPTTIADLSVSEGSNSPLDADSITATTRPSDYLRAHAAIMRTLAASSTLAAAGTTDLSTVTGTFITLTGAATTITALGTLAAGLYKHVIYNAAHTLTHNGTSLILLGAANRTVAAGDSSLFVSEGSGNWRELAFSDASVAPIGSFQPLDAQLTTLAAITAQQATDLAAVSTFMGTVLDDADASTALSTLGVSAFAKTILDDASGSAVFTTLGAAQSIATSGYQKLPSGLIVQWGTAADPGDSTLTVVTFPLAFPNAVFVAFPVVDTVETPDGPCRVTAKTLTTLTYDSNSGQAVKAATSWFAIGY